MDEAIESDPAGGGPASRRCVQDLLQLARMNRAEFSVRSEPIDLASAALEAGAQRYDAQARSFGVRLAVVTDGPAPALGDGERMLQVTSTSWRTQLRLTPAGGLVSISRSRQDRSAVDETRGPALKPEELPHGFERFYLNVALPRRATRRLGPRPRDHSKRFVESMRGNVEVTSAPGGPTRLARAAPLGACVERAPRRAR